MGGGDAVVEFGAWSGPSDERQSIDGADPGRYDEAQVFRELSHARSAVLPTPTHPVRECTSPTCTPFWSGELNTRAQQTVVDPLDIRVLACTTRRFRHRLFERTVRCLVVRGVQSIGHADE